MRFLFLGIVVPYLLFGRQIETFYGPFEVEEPILLELIDSSSFQRLKQIRQYGVGYYLSHHEDYTRYDHSLGVFAILRAKGATLSEQIAGLLHDVSHTAFSHVGDWIFHQENKRKGYQDEIHAFYLEQSGLGAILNQYHYTIEEILPQKEKYPALENELPDLCADRIDYNLQGAYHQKKLTLAEIHEIFDDLQFIEGRWVSTKTELMKKLSDFSLLMTETCWGGPANYLASRWLADAILRALELNILSLDDIHFGTDSALWEKLVEQTDPEIVEKMEKIVRVNDHFVSTSTSQADMVIKSKFRGINPWIISDRDYYRLTEVDTVWAKEYEHTRQRIELGWPIQMR